LLALEIDPERVEALYLMGNSYFKEEQYENAIAFYENYLASVSDHADVWYNVAVTYYQLGNEFDACRCFQRAVSLGMNIEPSKSLRKVCN
jgi:tetratricopeptide (TPR) repeat protein